MYENPCRVTESLPTIVERLEVLTDTCEATNNGLTDTCEATRSLIDTCETTR